MCSISIWLDFDFFKYTWLQGTIESNTQAELLGVYEMWQSAAEDHIQLLGRGDVALSLDLAGEGGSGPGTEGSEAAESRAGTPRDRSSSSAQQLGGGVALSRGQEEEEGEGGLEFYDCVDGDTGAGADGMPLLPRMSLSRSSSFTRAQRGLPLSSSGQQLHASLGVGPDGPRSTRDVVVTVVETIFVVAEASFWRVHGFYRTDVKELFNVAPETVLARIAYSFRPGAHSNLLAAPDFYGPLLAVMLLPQVLLLSIDVTRHGCSQSSMLGNAVVVSLSLWVGLSVLYRLLALVIAPGIQFKHCLSVTGYSFFAWSLALLCSYPLEKHKAVLPVPVPIALPLVLFGIPAALAQGWLFWEHAPFASLTMQQALFPSSVQHFAQRHSRLLQKVLWSVPKVAALVVVAGTHYQLLWYLARVFLPGRKHLCNLSALADRSQLGDVLSQKELRKYALLLLKGGSEE